MFRIERLEETFVSPTVTDPLGLGMFGSEPRPRAAEADAAMAKNATHVVSAPATPDAVRLL